MTEERECQAHVDGRKCDLQNDGVCAIHGIEIERRNLQLDGVKEELKQIPKLVSLANKALGAFGIISLVMTGIAIYARDIGLDHEADALKHEAKMGEVNDQISKLAETVARNEGKYLVTISGINELSRQIGSLVAIENARRQPLPIQQPNRMQSYPHYDNNNGGVK